MPLHGSTGAELAGFVPHRPARPEKSEGGKKFVLVSEYTPAGDQPTAIGDLVAGLKGEGLGTGEGARVQDDPDAGGVRQQNNIVNHGMIGERDQVLLGVTGSGKTFTMAKVIEAVQRPALILAPQQDARRPALQRVQILLPRQCGGIFRLVLRLLPAGSLYPAHRHLHRERLERERGDRPHAPFGDARDPGARRRHHRRLGLLHLRHRRGGDL
ncbi:MAG: DEAD/DEAH box helicase family protein [Rhizomicrobium sp.]